MKNVNLTNAPAKMISAACVLVLGCILVAGLWPFHTPHNAVSWPKNGNGLDFGRHGSAVGMNPFRNIRLPNDTGNSLEVWLTPERVSGGGCILAFDSSPDPRAPFVLRQYDTSIVLQRSLVNEQGRVTQLWFKVDHVFQAGKRVLATVSSNKNGTLLYVDGVVAGRSEDAGIANRELTGVLVLANSTVDDSWTGQMAGLAIYDRELTPTQVHSHFQSWTPDRGPLLAEERSPVALYLFNEGAGGTVHNRVDPSTSLTIPAKYFVLHPAFLRSTWDVYSHVRGVWKRWSFWEDLIVNIGGFVPVGFVFLSYCSSVRPTRHAALVVVLLGFLLSLVIEVLQRFLPNRDSGMTDLFTNTAGTGLGVLLHRSASIRTLWAKVLSLALPASETSRDLPSLNRGLTEGEEEIVSVRVLDDLGKREVVQAGGEEYE
jgi:hypothetical protein